MVNVPEAGGLVEVELEVITWHYMKRENQGCQEKGGKEAGLLSLWGFLLPMGVRSEGLSDLQLCFLFHFSKHCCLPDLADVSKRDHV